MEEKYQFLWEQMLPQLNEQQRRCFAGNMAVSVGRGGSTLVMKITGMSINTIKAGMREAEEKYRPCNGTVRRKGGGRKRVENKYDDICDKVMQVVDGSTYGNPENPLSWTTESMRGIANKLQENWGFKVAHNTVGRILDELGYSKQSNRKMLQVGEPHPDRNGQFEYINETASAKSNNATV